MQIKMKIKGTMPYHYTLMRILKLKRQTMPGFGWDGEELELSYTAGGNVKWYNHFRKQSVSS